MKGMFFSPTQYAPRGPKTDVDNYAKVLGDALVHCKIIKDDSQIQAIHGYKCQKCRNVKAKCRWAYHCELTFK